MQYYECHITIEGDSAATEAVVNQLGWKFSAIDGDPVMGKGVKCYATKHFNAKLPAEAVADTVGLVADELRSLGCNVTREKVELVIHDTRAKSVRVS